MTNDGVTQRESSESDDHRQGKLGMGHGNDLCPVASHPAPRGEHRHVWYAIFFFAIHFVMGSFLLWLLKLRATQLFDDVDKAHWLSGVGEGAWLIIGVIWGSVGWDRMKGELMGPGKRLHFFQSLYSASLLFLLVVAAAFVLDFYEAGGWPAGGTSYLLALLAVIPVVAVHVSIRREKSSRATAS